MLLPLTQEEEEEDEEQQHGDFSEEDADMDDAERAADARMGYTAADEGTAVTSPPHSRCCTCNG